MDWFKKKKRWDLETDVVVLGTGAAGMTAGLAAHGSGASVLLLEKSRLVGGTTAVSGGVVWVPNNHHLGEVGIEDSRAEAVDYVKRLTDGRTDDALVERFVDTAPAMVEWVESQTPLRFKALARYPDYHPEFPGGKPGGRSLDPGLFDANDLGPWKKSLRRSPVFGMTAMTVAEATDWGVFSKPLKLPFKLLGERYGKGLVCYGGALAGQLLKALLDRKIEPKLEHAARDLVVEEGRVTGVRVEHQGQELFVRARRGVILASGGFEWNRALAAQFLGGVLTHPNSPPGNEGDGLKMAMAAGADLANMSEAWWCPSLVIPGEEYDGKQLHRGDFATRSLPHTIIVNRKGRRFVNEAQNYNDLMKAFFAFEPNAYERPNLPAWLVFDHAYLEKYALMTVMPGQPAPEWLTKADTLDELARIVGIDPRGLGQTVDRFNGLAVEGVDPDFGRGESLYDRFYGDPDHQPNANLGTLLKKPFYALEVHPGAIGTKGGARVNVDAQVLRVDGAPIPGLYAAGNVMAGVTGAGYPGAGSTIAAAMTFGYLAGRHAAATNQT
ncbi:MAG TPA: FAD-dependent oxidoreductase [Polyangiaceae bacterium]|jgi:succinate dehydrogenase/fumarate reductase flavoprotein subunit